MIKNGAGEGMKVKKVSVDMAGNISQATLAGIIFVQ
jgi:hypothetical protein